MRVALIGTRGVPARYGGFETAVEEVGKRLVDRGHEVVVFCRDVPGTDDGPEYLGMERVVLPALRRKTLETLSHTGLSVLHKSLRNVDAAIVFNAANSPFLPVLRARGIPVATHVDGLEWKRSKWGPLGRRYYRVAESLAVNFSNDLIADAQGIADYYRKEFNTPTWMIPYGAPILENAGHGLIDEAGLRPREYHLVVARFERENHVLEAVRGYVRSNAKYPLVVVGSAPYADDYTAEIQAAADDRVRLVGGVWDQALLDELYANCLTYIHGHSVGGTNPSLLRAAGAAAPVVAFDVSFNREVVGQTGRYFANEADVEQHLEEAEAQPADCIARGAELQVEIHRYDWDEVAENYEDLFRHLALRGAGGTVAAFATRRVARLGA